MFQQPIKAPHYPSSRLLNHSAAWPHPTNLPHRLCCQKACAEGFNSYFWRALSEEDCQHIFQNILWTQELLLLNLKEPVTTASQPGWKINYWEVQGLFGRYLLNIFTCSRKIGLKIHFLYPVNHFFITASYLRVQSGLGKYTLTILLLMSGGSTLPPVIDTSCLTRCNISSGDLCIGRFETMIILL